ncbi:hypothetical protein YC2023_045838 [Brassica napus]
MILLGSLTLILPHICIGLIPYSKTRTHSRVTGRLGAWWQAYAAGECLHVRKNNQPIANQHFTTSDQEIGYSWALLFLYLFCSKQIKSQPISCLISRVNLSLRFIFRRSNMVEKKTVTPSTQNQSSSKTYQTPPSLPSPPPSSSPYTPRSPL